MNSIGLRVPLCFVLWTMLTVPCVGETWKGEEILPKPGAERFVTKAGGRKNAGCLDRMAWPAKVTKVDGQWLQISDPGGYSAKPLQGWLRKDDVVKLDKAQKEFSNKIRDPNANNSDIAEAYRLRGIYWESKDEFGIAIADYQAAWAKGRKTGDLHLRLGRALAKLAAREATINPTYAEKTFLRALIHFENAEDAFRSGYSKANPAELYISWGDALYERYSGCKPCGECEDVKLAMAKYRYAESLSPTWFVPPYRQGLLLLEVFKRLETEEKGRDRKTLLAAVQRLTQSIRLSPGQKEPYRERADALYRLAKAPDKCKKDCKKDCEKINCELCELSGQCGVRPEMLECPDLSSIKARRAILDQALQSADRAYLLGDNRDPESLEVKAKVQMAIANTFYGEEKPPNCSKELAVRLNILRSQLLLASSAELMNGAANRSRATTDIERRLTTAGKFLVRANAYRDYLNDNNLPHCKTPISIAILELKKQRQGLRSEFGDKDQIADSSLRRFAALVAASPDSEEVELFAVAVPTAELLAKGADEALKKAQERATPTSLNRAIEAIQNLDAYVDYLRKRDNKARKTLTKAAPTEFDALSDASTIPSVDLRPLMRLRDEIEKTPSPRRVELPLYTPLNLSN